MKNKLILGVLLFLMPLCNAIAQSVDLKTQRAELKINNRGFYSSIRINKQEILGKTSPLITACAGGKLLLPEKMDISGSNLKLTMTDKSTVVLNYKKTNSYVTLEVISVPSKYDAILFGPLGVNINETVGDIIGVVQGKGVAWGIQALNIKTNAGIPYEYIAQVQQQFNCKGKSTELSVGSIPDYRLAAVRQETGATLQFSCRNRSKTEERTVQQLKGALVLPVTGEDALIKGAKIALFGCSDNEALSYISKIEIEQHLPHPLFDGEWGKTARSAMRSYLISSFSENNIDFVLDKAEKAGFKYIYHSEPFSSWGHFNWSKYFVTGGDDAVKALVERAAKRGIAIGVHTLSNFTTTNDAYVTPIPSEHLLKQGELKLLHDIDAAQNQLIIKKSNLFALPMSLNAMMIDKEIICYGKTKEDGDSLILSNCRRGAFGTTASAHLSKSTLYKLWDYPYMTLFPDVELQDQYADRLAEIFNKTGLKQISFDGLEGCTYTGQDDYATARFVDRFWKKLDHNVLNDASNLNHYTWHIHTRMNWGEPWGEAMRKGQIENRIKNQEFFKRNLFPKMLGWFLIRLADKQFECTSLEDLEWAMSEAAGFDAGFGMTITVPTLRRHGQIDTLLEAIKNWDILRENKCFSEAQMKRLKDPETEWHLEKQKDGLFLLYPLNISKRFHCSMGEMQPGQSGGSDWLMNTPFGGLYAIRLKVEGEEEDVIENPKFITESGTLMFATEIKAGQYLMYDFNGKAMVTDKNYNLIRTVEVQGNAALPQGDSHIAFSCSKKGDCSPDIVVRFITRGKPETIKQQTIK